MDMFPEGDFIIKALVGRLSSFSGSDFTTRDIGWYAGSLEEANKIKNDIESTGKFKAEIHFFSEDED